MRARHERTWAMVVASVTVAAAIMWSAAAACAGAAYADEPAASTAGEQAGSFTTTVPEFYALEAYEGGEKSPGGASDSEPSPDGEPGDGQSQEDALGLRGDAALAYDLSGLLVPNPTTEEFIASIGEDARAIGQKRGLYASVMIAQAILESGSGSSGLSKPPYNNLFGIKGSYKGRSVTMATSEDDGSGAKYDINAGFRSYPSVRDSLKDYADLLTVQMASFYAPALKANAPTFADACNYLQGRYATDTTYAAKLKRIIATYNLTSYDVPRGQQPALSGTAVLMISGELPMSPGITSTVQVSAADVSYDGAIAAIAAASFLVVLLAAGFAALQRNEALSGAVRASR